MKKVLAYILILVVVIIVFMFVFNNLKGSKILDNTDQLQELGLTDNGNQFVTINKPSFDQTVRSPLTVQLEVKNVDGPMTIALRDENDKILASKEFNISASDSSKVTGSLEFNKTGGTGYLDVFFQSEAYQGVRLPVKF